MLPGVMLFVGGTVESGMAPLAWVILFLLCLLAYSWGGALVYAFEIHNVLGRILIHIYACAAVSSIPFSLLAIFWWSLQFQSFGWEGRTPAAFVLCLLAIALVTSMLLVERARRLHTFE